MNPTLWRILSCYLIIALSILLCEYASFWFYPLAILAIGSQFLALALLGHEASHGHLHKNRSINNFVGRYLCHFPVFSSHAYYTMTHFKHHRELGKATDPDYFIYQNSYPSMNAWFISSVKDTLTLKLFLEFLMYFNGAPLYFTGKYPYKIKTDYGRFFLFWGTIFLVCIHFKVLPHLLYFGFIPSIIWMPWIKVLNSFQHLADDHAHHFRAYNIIFKNWWLQEFLFPVNINFHEVHHRQPNIPYYQLPDYFKNTPNTYTLKEFSKKVFNSQMSKTS